MSQEYNIETKFNKALKDIQTVINLEKVINA